MSAKKARPSSPKSSARVPAAAPAADPTEESVASSATAAATASWFDSADPRKRQLARLALAGVWLYIGALWLLALDQTFEWGIF